jgi:glycosyltransferase 2 family protein
MNEPKRVFKFLINQNRDYLINFRWAFSYVIPILVSLISINFIVSHFSINDLVNVKDALNEVTIGGIILSLSLTSLSYIALISYDLVALWKMGVKLPIRIVFLTSFSSFACSFNLGFPIITGLGLRLHIYGREEITTSHIAHLSLINGITFWIGICGSLGISLINSSDFLTLVDRLPKNIHIMAGAILIISLSLYYLWISIRNRTVSFKNTFFSFPEPKITVAQCIIGISEVFAASAALYVLLPQNNAYNYMDFTVLYVISCVAGIISHVPGGIGVFETVMTQAGSKISDVNILGSLVAFRAIYYFLPFCISMILVAINEWPRILSSLLSIKCIFRNK